MKPKDTVNVGDAISDLPPIENGSGSERMLYENKPISDYQAMLRNGNNFLFNDVCSKMGPVMMKRIRKVPKRPGAGWLDLPDDLKPKNLIKHGDNRYPNRFGRLHWEGIFNTILTKPEPYWGRVVHPTEDRVISVREVLTQSFPDNVIFKGRLSEQYKQVGNAVPPLLATAIGHEVVKALINIT